MTFKTGDRIVSIEVKDCNQPTGRVIRGTVVQSYAYRSMNGRWFYPEVYRVRWDDGKIEQGILPGALHPESFADTLLYRLNTPREVWDPQ